LKVPFNPKDGTPLLAVAEGWSLARVPVTPVPCGVAGLPKACGGKPCDEGGGVPAWADQSRDPNDTRRFGTKLATAIPAPEGLAFRLASAPALYPSQSRYREACSANHKACD